MYQQVNIWIDQYINIWIYQKWDQYIQNEINIHQQPTFLRTFWIRWTVAWKMRRHLSFHLIGKPRAVLYIYEPVTKHPKTFMMPEPDKIWGSLKYCWTRLSHALKYFAQVTKVEGIVAFRRCREQDERQILIQFNRRLDNRRTQLLQFRIKIWQKPGTDALKDIRERLRHKWKECGFWIHCSNSNIFRWIFICDFLNIHPWIFQMTI